MFLKNSSNLIFEQKSIQEMKELSDLPRVDDAR
jgi:hypothetical protein